jgi:hypothetical protein
MIGIYHDGGLEFSTYRRSQKVLSYGRNSNACCIVAPDDNERALLLRGTVEVVAGHPMRSLESPVLPGVTLDASISETAQARAAAGKRVTLRLTPHEARFIGGFTAENIVGA